MCPKTSGDEYFREYIHTLNVLTCFTFVFGLAWIDASQQVKQPFFSFCALDRKAESVLTMSHLVYLPSSQQVNTGSLSLRENTQGASSVIWKSWICRLSCGLFTSLNYQIRSYCTWQLFIFSRVFRRNLPFCAFIWTSRNSSYSQAKPE